MTIEQSKIQLQALLGELQYYSHLIAGLKPLIMHANSWLSEPMDYKPM